MHINNAGINFISLLMELLSPRFYYVGKLTQEWNEFYKKTFASFEFSPLSSQVVPRKPRFSMFFLRWLVMVPYEIGLVEICEVLKRKRWIDEGIDLPGLVSDRYSFHCGSYGVWTPAALESYQSYNCFSVTRQVRKKFSIGIITLEERLLLEMFLYNKYGRHLDCTYGTICSGSFDTINKTIPIVYWDDEIGKLIIIFMRPRSFPSFAYPRFVIPCGCSDF